MKRWCLRNIARPRPPQEFVPQIDGLRFVAIMSVLLYHIQGFVAAKAAPVIQEPSGLFQRILGEGSFGVPLFFALSGYILCRPFLGGRQVSLKRYFTRRISRLKPPYLISLVLVFAAKLWALKLTFADLWPNLVASVFYSHNLVYGAQSAVNGVAWSLEVEWQFYLLAPLIFAIVARSPGALRHAGLLILIGLGGWAYAASFEADPRMALSLLSYFGFFMAGVWVAVLDEDHPAFGRDSVRFDLLGVAAWVGVLPGSPDHALLIFSLVAVPLVLAVCAIPYLLIERPFMVWRPGRNRLVDAFRRPS